MKKLKVLLVILTLMYLAISFIEITINFKLWEYEMRYGFILGSIMIFIVFQMFFDED